MRLFRICLSELVSGNLSKWYNFLVVVSKELFFTMLLHTVNIESNERYVLLKRADPYLE
jgi:hypothetical protein